MAKNYISHSRWLARPLAALMLLAAGAATAQTTTITYTGGLTATDPTIPGGRLTRNNTASVCGTAKGFPGLNSNVGVYYDTYSFQSNAAACVTVNLTYSCPEATGQVFSIAYDGSFTPINPAQNYKGDTGASAYNAAPTVTMAINVTAGQIIILEVNETTAGSICSSYTLQAVSSVSNSLTNALDLVITTPLTIPTGTYNSITVNAGGVGTPNGPLTVNNAVVVNNGGTLNDGCAVISGAGTFTVAAGGTLGICAAAGIAATGATGAIQTTGTRSFGSDASYVYNGTVAQATGSGLPAQVRNLSITNANDLTLSQPLSVRQALTVTNAGNLALNGQPLTLLSDASGTALVVNSGTGLVTGGTATVQRYIDPSLNAGLGYRHLSAPVGGSTVNNLATAGFTPVVNASYNSSATPGTVTPFPTVFGYDQSRVGTVTSNFAPFDQGWASPTTLTGALAVGQGYAVNLTGGLTPNFTGTLTSGTQTLTLSRSSNPAAGWALVGNPYPAPLDYGLVASSDRSGLDAAIYVFESSSPYTGSYRASVNGVGGNGNSGSALVGTGQGFFVRVSNGQPSGSLTFRNAQRLTSYASQVPVRRAAADTRPLVQLALRGGNVPADNLFVYVQAGATAGLDSEFDAVKRPNSTGLNLSAPTATGEALAIQGLPLLSGATVVPLTVDVPATGSYALAAPTLNNLPVSTRVELVDNLTGTRQDLRLLPAAGYAFTAAATHLSGRFSLELTPAGALATAAAALAAQVLAFPNPAHDRLTLVRPAGAATSAELVNALGQVVRRFALPTAETSLDVRELATGVYLLRLRLDGQPVNKRLVIE